LKTVYEILNAAVGVTQGDANGHRCKYPKRKISIQE